MSEMLVNSNTYFTRQWKIWKLCGIYAEPRLNYKTLYWTYAVLLNIIVTILYPLHLSVLIFRNDTLGDDIKNLSIFLTTVAGSIKFLSFAMNLKKMPEIQNLLNELDARVRSKDERHFYNTELKMKMKITGNIYLVLYIIVAITAELTTLMSKERVLLYPAWFPFDWRASTTMYLLAHLYQIIGISTILTQNYANETTPGLLLCLLAGHIKLLALRVAKTSHNCENPQENELELLRCVRDQKNLYRLCDLIEDLVAFPMFVQITIAAANICVALAALLFYLNDYFNRAYYSLYFFGLFLQIFPACYFGTEFQMMFDQLPYAVFSSNWMHQSKRYKMHMILFTERALMQRTILAGGIVRLNLEAFLSACKGAYSLFAVFLNLKE
ncbi:odorant receptor 59a-like [Teleopsis dalmanni]|uniref:odorant receptor 59a-like n=1 Tax=Teleopsis dalmanni TaxID=139649 RepID=UPI0018CF785F|nr:odorant receptor 59a-like [Teleopsis dalmanni]